MPRYSLQQLILAVLLFLGICTGSSTLLAASPHSLPADSTAYHLEAQTLRRKVAQRLHGEADSTFLQRILPISYPGSHDLLAYSWRPSAFGKQLFFSTQGQGTDFYKSFFFILDPFQTDTYSVQCFELIVDSDCDLPPDLDAIFFADVDQNGQKDLLALAHCSSREPAGQSEQGQQLYGHEGHYITQVYQLAGLDSSGRPSYRPDPILRPYLDDLETAADVRLALARHQQRGKLPPRKRVQPPSKTSH